jgi:hypothetical protein
MKSIFPAVLWSLCLLMAFQAQGIMAAASQDPPAANTPASKSAPATKIAPVKKTAPAKENGKPVQKRAPIASKSKSASEIVKIALPPARLDLSLPKDMVDELDPVGTVPLPQHDAILPQMFGDKTGSSPFQLNGRLLSNEMQLQLRNEERRDVEGAALEFEFKQ